MSQFGRKTIAPLEYVHFSITQIEVGTPDLYLLSCFSVVFFGICLLLTVTVYMYFIHILQIQNRILQKKKHIANLSPLERG